MKTLIVYQSNYGQTKKIAAKIEAELTLLKKTDDELDILELSKHQSLEKVNYPIDRVIVGTPVYTSRFPKQIMKWMRINSELLKSTEVNFFTVSLNVADPNPSARKADDDLLLKLCEQSSLTPRFVASFAGSLEYTKYGFIIKFIMKRISRKAGGPTDTSKNHEMTNWKVVSDFASAINKNDVRSEFYFQNRFLSELNPQLNDSRYQTRVKDILSGRPVCN